MNGHSALLSTTTIALATLVVVDAAPIVECRALEIADRDAARACYVERLSDASVVVRAEAAWALGDVQLANSLFRAAVRAAPDDADARVRWGELFLATYQVADAEALFVEALGLVADNADAKLGLARLALNRFEGQAHKLLKDVLGADGDNQKAKLLLARLALEVGDTERAQSALGELLTARDTHLKLEAMALSAALDHRLGIAPSPWEAKALAIHPGYGELFETIAHFYIITRRYREAIEHLNRATDIQPELWSAQATLGINLLRVNRFDAGREALQRAHEGDPYNVEVVNALRLLDSLEGWDVVAEDGLVLRTHPDESGALAHYVRRLVGDAVRVVGGRYGFVPDYPVVVELYPRHQDFAVRTSGLPGIGVLGVAFGDVVLMDSPAARSVDEGFDWASALWHEVAHVVTLGATGNLVSRWFSEGVSVFEEWQTGPSRFVGNSSAVGAAAYRAVPTRVVEAYRADRLLQVADLGRGLHPPDLSRPGHGLVHPGGTALRIHRPRPRPGGARPDTRRLSRRRRYRRGRRNRARHHRTGVGRSIRGIPRGAVHGGRSRRVRHGDGQGHRGGVQRRLDRNGAGAAASGGQLSQSRGRREPLPPAGDRRGTQRPAIGSRGGLGHLLAGRRAFAGGAPSAGGVARRGGRCGTRALGSAFPGANGTARHLEPYATGR